MPDAGIFRRATHGMTPKEARAWWAGAEPPKGQYMRAQLGPKLPCETLSSGRHNAGRKRRRGPTERAQKDMVYGRERLPVRDYYHQAGFGQRLPL